MKRLIPLLLAVLLFCLVPAAVFASTTTYEIDELYMTVDMPDDLIVVTRDSDPDDPIFEGTGVDIASVQEDFQSEDLYLDSVSIEDEYRIYLTMQETADSREIFDLNQYSTAELQAIPELLGSTFDDIPNAELVSTDVYTHNAVPFLVINLEITVQDTLGYAQGYITVYNGQVIMFFATRYYDELTSSMENTLQDIIDSVAFTKTLPNPNPRIQPIVFIVGGILGVLAFVGAIVLIVVLLSKKKKNAASAYPTAPGGYPGSFNPYPGTTMPAQAPSQNPYTSPPAPTYGTAPSPYPNQPAPYGQPRAPYPAPVQPSPYATPAQNAPQQPYYAPPANPNYQQVPPVAPQQPTAPAQPPPYYNQPASPPAQQPAPYQPQQTPPPGWPR